MNFGVSLFDGIRIPELPHGGGTKGSVDGVGQVFLVRFRDQDGQSLESLLASYVTARNGGFEPDQAIFVVCRGGEQTVAILCQPVPVSELTGGGGPGIVVFTTQQLSEQREVGLLDVAVCPHCLHLVMPEARIFGIELLDPLIKGFFDLGRFHFPQFPLGPVAVTVFAPLEDVQQLNEGGSGDLGGLDLPIILSWLVGGVFAAAAAWVVGKVSLGLRADYLAIATLGISEIIIYVLKFEDWLSRGVKNVNGLPRPVPYEVDLQANSWFIALADTLNLPLVDASSLVVKICYALLFTAVLLAVLWLSETALRSPWGRMMRAIRDNETAANAMGKNVTKQHLLVFVLGSAVIGVAGAMMVTLDGQFTPTSYQPLRFTFLIWVMVIAGGSGNNWGAVLGGFLIWFFWIEAEPIGLWLMDVVTSGLPPTHWLRLHLLESAAHTRLMTMGVILLLVLRFSPRGLIPESRR